MAAPQLRDVAVRHVATKTPFKIPSWRYIAATECPHSTIRLHIYTSDGVRLLPTFSAFRSLIRFHLRHPLRWVQKIIWNISQRSSLFWYVTQRRVVVHRRRFGITSRCGSSSQRKTPETLWYANLSENRT